jgi:hypothetical protein
MPSITSEDPEAVAGLADGPGEQTVILLFDSPQTIGRIGVEVEELSPAFDP